MSEKPSVTVAHEDAPHGGRYVAHVDGSAHTGHLDWEPVEEGVRVATHTIVPPQIGGRGVAAILVNRLIEDARSQDFRIVPQCWYVAKKFDENPDWADLRA